MRLTTVNLILSPLVVCIFWITNWPNKPESNPDLLLRSFDLRKTNQSVWLIPDRLKQLLDSDRTNESLIAAARVFIQTFCELDSDAAPSVFHSQCCQNGLSGNLSLLQRCMAHGGELGPVPHAVDEATGLRTLLKSAPPFRHSQVYIDGDSWPNRTIECPVQTEKRSRLYRLLLEWIRLAEAHQIVWWIHFGSLIGSMRHGDFIPYDHDMDIAVLGPEEQLIRSLESHWPEVDYHKVSLVTRQRDYCINDHGTRLNCQRVPVRYQLDPCAFCTPLARLISSYTTFLDLFIVQPNLLVHNAGPKVEAKFGLFDESVDGDRNRTLSYTFSQIFPLSRCPYMGLSLPCPRDPVRILQHTYGEHVLRPNKLCNQRLGYWYNT